MWCGTEGSRCSTHETCRHSVCWCFFHAVSPTFQFRNHQKQMVGICWNQYESMTKSKWPSEIYQLCCLQISGHGFAPESMLSFWVIWPLETLKNQVLVTQVQCAEPYFIRVRLCDGFLKYPKMVVPNGTPSYGWFALENPIEMDDLGWFGVSHLIGTLMWIQRDWSWS